MEIAAGVAILAVLLPQEFTQVFAVGCYFCVCRSQGKACDSFRKYPPTSKNLIAGRVPLRSLTEGEANSCGLQWFRYET